MTPMHSPTPPSDGYMTLAMSHTRRHTAGMFQDPDALMAHPVVLIALPAFIPAVTLIAVIIYIARKDRREERLEQEQNLLGTTASTPTQPKETL